MKPRVLMATAFALGLAFGGCGSITAQDGGTSGTAGAGSGAAGTSGSAGTTGGAGT